MTFKTLSVSAIVLLVVVAIQLVTSASELKGPESVFEENQSHNLTIGRRKQGDRLLNTTEITISRRFLWYVKYYFQFPLPKKHQNRNTKISFIRIVDNVPNDEGGYPSLISGGPGTNHTKIYLESRWNRGINFTITIYGR